METRDRTGVSWRATLPCPDCGNMTVIGYLLVDENGNHMHTRYVCTFWKANPPGLYERSVTRPCDWSGRSIPGWDEERK